ncbi:uncharacterized protein [Arachis hypogaea]|uniref:uncharacterized protein n=1 Tax=Arachis hypogaea TaxID=3818 RepID=UPI000DECA4A9|nr:uncharacterized protein LOC112757586 [Arachis hypogaea]
MIAEVIKPLVETDPSLKVKYVIAEVQSKFNYTTSYRKAWLVKQKAMRTFLVVGKLLTNLCRRGLKQWSCKPIVQVDGTHLYGKYKGALLVAVSQDGNGNIVPLTFAVVEGEISDA